MAEVFDIVVVGGGINGAGIARDAAGRGLSVLLCEKDDLASATSSASTKLIHGGLRYLEYYEFRLVREALIEREVLLRAAPHIIWPLRFVLPHNKGLRPAWMIRLGLFLYDHLGGRKLLPASQGIDLRRHPAGEALEADLRRAFVYSDCWVQDSRLVVLNAIDAAERGAEILTRVECLSARRDGDRWRVVLSDRRDGSRREVEARALVNAAGPWTAEFLERRAGLNRVQSLRLVKGSHIVVPKLFDHDFPYIFQNPDGRIVFAIPYEDDFTLIGTTDVDFTGDAGEVAISEEEKRYLCAAVNAYFKRKISPADVVWTYSGVRPLYDDAAESASSATRDYVLEMDHAAGTAPLLSIFGGKITTFRKLAEHALARLEEGLGPLGQPWTASVPLPGGDMPGADFEGCLVRFRQAHPWLPDDLSRRYLRNYGTRAQLLLEGASDLTGLGECLGDGLYAAEARYLMRREWADTADDMLWRRSKLGLHVSEATRRNLEAWIARQGAGAERQETA
ncbi:MAG: glycerol-3-phosphate dehydrogenase [Kiloniellaceae bacterium]